MPEVIVFVLQVYDMKNRDPEGEFKDRGRRKAIILCRADWAHENRDNIILMLSTLKLLPAVRRMAIPYSFIGDMKVQAALLGEECVDAMMLAI